MGYIREDKLIQFPNQDNGMPAMSGSYNWLYFDGFLDGDCNIPTGFDLEPFLSFVIRFSCVQGDS